MLLGRVGLVALAVATVATAAPGAAVRAERCASADTAAGLDAFFGSDDAAGLAGADYPHAYALPDGRTLWLFQDAFVGGDRSLIGDRFAHNAALVQDGACFELLPAPGGDGTSFLGSWVERGLNDWIWPLDAEVGVDGNLWLFVAEMHNPTSTGAASGAFPLGTWRARYSLPELELIDFQPAADPGRSLFGYSIVSDEDWSYLYGHCYTQFAAALQAIGFDPSCSPYAYLARVPKGEFDDEPEYWDGKGWTDDREAREPVLEADPSMPVSVERFGDVYVAVSDEGDWYGDEVVVRTAPLPQGPWTEVLRYTPETACPDCNNYGAFVLARLEGDRVVVAQSNNAWDMGAAFADASLYRVDVRAIDVPGVSAASLERTPAAQLQPVVEEERSRARPVGTVSRAPRQQQEPPARAPQTATAATGASGDDDAGIAGRAARVARAVVLGAGALIAAAALLGLVRTVMLERRRRCPHRPSTERNGRTRRHATPTASPAREIDRSEPDHELVGSGSE